MQDFLGIDCQDAAPHASYYRIIPFGLEASVSYGSGTALGPAAIITASQEVETFDMEFGREAYLDYGFETLQPVPVDPSLPSAMDQLTGLVGQALSDDKVPVTLGGEHSLTFGAVRAVAAKYPRLTLVQFDAHCDLRDGYMGEHYSHAAVIRRCLELGDVDVVMIGIRNMAVEEHAFAASEARVHIYDAEQVHGTDLDLLAAQLGELVRGKDIYVTFDIDAFDSALMPSTGTPEPGGLSWRQAETLLRAACRDANVRGMDLVELAPKPEFHAPDFVAAKLLYKMMSYGHGTNARTGR